MFSKQAPLSTLPMEAPPTTLMVPQETAGVPRGTGWGAWRPHRRAPTALHSAIQVPASAAGPPEDIPSAPLTLEQVADGLLAPHRSWCCPTIVGRQ